LPLDHPILTQSFAQIDREVGAHGLTAQEYAIARRIIHTTADFEYLNLLNVSPTAIAVALQALRAGTTIVTDVSLVRQGILSLVAKTFNNPILTALDFAPEAEAGKTRTETGMLRCWAQYPRAIYVIGNAPTALLALCHELSTLSPHLPRPPLIIGAPVGFVSVLESKQALTRLPVPQIVIGGRKGGSTVAAAIVNALLILAYQEN
jgi:precorrin-8X/cobalt-precorrin-8 methylmutase